MNDWFSNPAVQSLALPLFAGLAAAGLLRLVGGRVGHCLAAAGIGAGYGYAVVTDLDAMRFRSILGNGVGRSHLDIRTAWRRRTFDSHLCPGQFPEVVAQKAYRLLDAWRFVR